MPGDVGIAAEFRYVHSGDGNLGGWPVAQAIKSSGSKVQELAVLKLLWFFKQSVSDFLNSVQPDFFEVFQNLMGDFVLLRCVDFEQAFERRVALENADAVNADVQARRAFARADANSKQPCQHLVGMAQSFNFGRTRSAVLLQEPKILFRDLQAFAQLNVFNLTH